MYVYVSNIHIHILEQIELPAKLLNYFVWSNKSNINQMLHEGQSGVIV